MVGKEKKEYMYQPIESETKSARSILYNKRTQSVGYLLDDQYMYIENDTLNYINTNHISTVLIRRTLINLRIIRERIITLRTMRRSQNTLRMMRKNMLTIRVKLRESRFDCISMFTV